jgi:hypothetical protein
MAWDKEHVRRLDYVTRNDNQDTRVQESALDGKRQP